MVALKVEDVRAFTSKLFVKEDFDGFLVKEITIVTFNSFTIDGHIKQGYYSEEELDQLLETYLERKPDTEERFATYAYAALGGFLWCLWAVFKSMEGVEFGDYTIVMYHYAKQYYKKIQKELPAE